MSTAAGRTSLLSAAFCISWCLSSGHWDPVEHTRVSSQPPHFLYISFQTKYVEGWFPLRSDSHTRQEATKKFTEGAGLGGKSRVEVRIGLILQVHYLTKNKSFENMPKFWVLWGFFPFTSAILDRVSGRWQLLLFTGIACNINCNWPDWRCVTPTIWCFPNTKHGSLTQLSTYQAQWK